MALQFYEYILTYVCIFLLFVFTILFFRLGKRHIKEMETTGQMYYGFGVLFLFLLISRIIDNPLYDLVWPANNFPTQNTTIFAWLNTNFAFYYNGPPFIVGSIIFQPWMIVNLIFLIGVAIAVFFMEKNFIPKAHHIFSIFTVFMSISSLVLSFNAGQF